MKISAEKKKDEGPILPRVVSDSIIDIQDQDDKNGVKAEIEAVDKAKLVSGKCKRETSPDPHPTKTVMKEKAKKTSACQHASKCVASSVSLSFPS